jgi:phage-related minor tail protein
MSDELSVEFGADISDLANAFDDLIKALSDFTNTMKQASGTASNDFDRIGNSGQEAADEVEKGQDQMQKSMKDTESSLEYLSGKFGDVGEELTKSVTVPLAGLGTDGFLVASDVQEGQGKIQASLGVTAGEAQHLGDIAEQVWKNNFGDNIGDVSDALIQVRKNMGNLTDADLQKMITSAYTLASAFDADIADSTKTAATLMKNFDVDGQHAMDLITVGFQKGGDYSGELLDTLNEYAPQFSAMGMSADDFLGILIAGAQAGAFSLDKVGDAVKEFNIRAQDGSKTTSDGFKMIGMDAQKMGEAISHGGAEGKKAFEATVTALAAMKDPVKQNTAGVNLFGTQWEDVRSNVILAMKDGVGSINNIDGATKKAGDALSNNLGAKAKQMWRDFQDELKPVGDVLIDLAENILPPIGKGLSDIASAFSTLSPGVQTALVVFGLLLAGLGPLLVIIGSIVDAVMTLIPVFTAIGTAIAAVSVPIWPLIAAVAALIAIGVLLYQNWDAVKAYAIQIWGEIAAFLKPLIADIVAFFIF